MTLNGKILKQEEEEEKFDIVRNILMNCDVNNFIKNCFSDIPNNSVTSLRLGNLVKQNEIIPTTNLIIGFKVTPKVHRVQLVCSS